MPDFGGMFKDCLLLTEIDIFFTRFTSMDISEMCLWEILGSVYSVRAGGLVLEL